MDVDVQHIALVVRALLVIDTVRKHLPVELFGQDAPPGLPPARGAGQFWEGATQVEEPEPFAGQMRVGGEIRRQV